MKRFIKIVFAFIALGTFALCLVQMLQRKFGNEQMVEHDLGLVTVPDTAIISFPVAVRAHGSQFNFKHYNKLYKITNNSE